MSEIPEPKCRHLRNAFCLVCGEFTKEFVRRLRINESIKMNYLYCFAKDIVQDDHVPGEI